MRLSFFLFGIMLLLGSCSPDHVLESGDDTTNV